MSQAPFPDSGTPAVEPTMDVVVSGLAGELDVLRRKVDDNGALIRRNQLSLTELAESVGKLVAQQRRRERGFTLNSFVAYFLFTALLGGGFFMLYSSRAGELVKSRNHAVQEADKAEKQLTALLEEIAARDAAAATASAYYQLLRDGQRDKAIAQYPEVQAAALTPTEREIFAAGEKRARAEIVDAGYLAGLDAYRAAKLPEAITELKRALGYEEEGPRAALMRYYLGVAQVKTDAAEDGAKQLELALAGRVDEAGIVDARFWLATALEKLGKLDEARAEYDKFASANPTSPLSVSARRKSAALARRAVHKN